MFVGFGVGCDCVELYVEYVDEEFGEFVGLFCDCVCFWVVNGIVGE